MVRNTILIILFLASFIIFGISLFIFFQDNSVDESELIAFNRAKSGSIEDIENYSKNYPDGEYSEEVGNLRKLWEIEKSEFHKLAKETSIECKQFLKKYPESMFVKDVEELLNQKLEQEAYDKANSGGSVECENFIRNFPKSNRIEAVKKKFLTLPILVNPIEDSNFFSVAVLPEKNLLAIGTKYDSGEKYSNHLRLLKGELIVYDIENIRVPKNLFSFKPNDMDVVRKIRFLPMRNLLVVGTAKLDKLNDFYPSVEVIVFDVKNKNNITEISRFNSGMANVIQTISVSPDEKFIAYGTYDHMVILDITDLKRIKEIDRSKCHDHVLRQINYSPDGKYIVSCSAKDTGKFNEDNILVKEGEFKLWKTVETGEVWEANSTICHERTALSVAFSSNSNYLASGSYNHEVKIWDISDIQNVTEVATFDEIDDNVTNLQFSKDDTQLLFSTFGMINVCDVNDFKTININRLLKCDAFIMDLTYSHNDSLIIACTNQNGLYIWPTEKYLEKLLNSNN